MSRYIERKPMLPCPGVTFFSATASSTSGIPVELGKPTAAIVALKKLRGARSVFAWMKPIVQPANTYTGGSSRIGHDDAITSGLACCSIDVKSLHGSVTFMLSFENAPMPLRLQDPPARHPHARRRGTAFTRLQHRRQATMNASSASVPVSASKRTAVPLPSSDMVRVQWRQRARVLYEGRASNAGVGTVAARGHFPLPALRANRISRPEIQPGVALHWSSRARRLLDSSS